MPNLYESAKSLGCYSGNFIDDLVQMVKKTECRFCPDSEDAHVAYYECASYTCTNRMCKADTTFVAGLPYCPECKEAAEEVELSIRLYGDPKNGGQA